MRACDNPFAAFRLEALRFRLDEDGWGGLLARWRAQNGRGALVGPHGSGKTQLQLELARRLEAEGFAVRRLQWGRDRGPSATEQAEALRGLGPRDVLMIDGAEQLAPYAWWWLRGKARGAGGLVVTTHRPGRLPPLFVHRTSLALLLDLVGDLVGGARAAALRSLCDALYTRHSGNLRECLRSLYDVHAQRGAG